MKKKLGRPRNVKLYNDVARLTRAGRTARDIAAHLNQGPIEIHRIVRVLADEGRIEKVDARKGRAPLEPETHLGKLILENWYEKQGLRMYELAEAVKVQQPQVSNWLHRRSEINALYLRPLAVALQVSVDDVLDAIEKDAK